MLEREKYIKILLFLLIAVFGRILLQIIPGAAPIIPMALFAGANYGLEAAVFVGAGAFALSFFLIHGEIGLGNIFHIVIAISFIVSGIFLAIKVLRIGKHGQINPQIMVFRVTIATVFIEVALSLMQGEIFRSPHSYYHLLANIVLAAIIGGIGKKEPG